MTNVVSTLRCGGPCSICQGRRIVQRADGSFIRCWPCRKVCGRIVLPGGARWTKKRHEEIKREARELYGIDIC